MNAEVFVDTNVLLDSIRRRTGIRSEASAVRSS